MLGVLLSSGLGLEDGPLPAIGLLLYEELQERQTKIWNRPLDCGDDSSTSLSLSSGSFKSELLMFSQMRLATGCRRLASKPLKVFFRTEFQTVVFKFLLDDQAGESHNPELSLARHSSCCTVCKAANHEPTMRV